MNRQAESNLLGTWEGRDYYRVEEEGGVFCESSIAGHASTRIRHDSLDVVPAGARRAFQSATRFESV